MTLFVQGGHNLRLLWILENNSGQLRLDWNLENNSGQLRLDCKISGQLRLVGSLAKFRLQQDLFFKDFKTTLFCAHEVVFYNQLFYILFTGLVSYLQVQNRLVKVEIIIITVLFLISFQNCFSSTWYQLQLF